MSWRGTLLLVILAALALGFLFLSGRSRTHPPLEPLLGIDPSTADSIEIREGGALISLIKTNGIWMVQGDLKNNTVPTDRANPALVNSLLETAADIIPLDILRSPDLKGAVSLSSLGLKKRNRSLSIHAEKKVTLWIGVEGAAPGSLYARLDSGKTVYLIDGKIESLAFRPAQDFRDTRLTDLDPDHINEVSITKGGGMQQLLLDKTQKKNWSLETPVSARGDDQAITSLLNSLTGARVIRWMPEGTDSASCGLDTPSATVSLKEEGATNPLTITIGSAASDADAPGSFFVRSSERPGICIVAGLGTTLSATPQTLRSKKIAEVEYDTVDRIEVDHCSLKRKAGSEDWISHDEGKSNEEVVPGDQMKHWYDQLQGLHAASFEAATPEHLEQRKLTATNHPLTIRLIATLSDNTAQEDKGETVLATYQFGLPTNNEIALHEGNTTDLLIMPSGSMDFLKTFPGVEYSPAIDTVVKPAPDQIKQ